MKIYVVAILLIILDIGGSSQKPNEIYSHLGSTTPYRFNANLNISDINEEIGCATKIWMILRHGTRYPSSDDILDISSRLSEIKAIILKANVDEKSILTTEEIDLFEAWSFFQNITEHQLVPEGEIENYDMAQRMRTRYPNLFPSNFDNDTYLFKFTNNQRTRESARYFAIGLFGEGNIKNVYFPEASYEDLLVLRFYQLCSKWINEVDNNPDAVIEKKLFEASSTMRNIAVKINQGLGLTNELSLQDVQLMYKTCAYETAWYRNAASPWCIPFDLNATKIFEYVEDLNSYWIDGYGFELTYKQACPAFVDMIRFFDDDETGRKAILYFTHSGTLLKFIAHLGLYNDSIPLFHEDFQTNDERKWRDSKIDNFATNIAFVLYTCGDSKKVLVRHNEYIIRLPICPHSDLCDLEDMKAYYEESIKNCNFDEICENNYSIYNDRFK